MNALAVTLGLLLGSGGIGGVVAFLRFRTDKGATIVDSVSKGVLVLERLNDRLEGDLNDERAQRTEEHLGRVAAETERDELRRLLAQYGPLPSDREPPRSPRAGG